MIRILHLIEHDADLQSLRGAHVLRRDLGEGFSRDLRTVGTRGDYRNLLSAILHQRSAQSYDILHAWGARALATAAVLGGRIVYTPGPSTNSRDVRWLRAIMGYRDVQVLCPTATLRKSLVRGGVPIERCHLVRPGVEFARINRRRNAALREALGFAEVDRVFLAAGESTRAARHEHAVWATALLHVMDARHKLLLWGRGKRARDVERFAHRLGQPAMTVLAERRLGRAVEYEELLAAADAVVVSATGPVATLPICIAMAAGLPIAATVTYTVSELLEDRHTAFLSPKGAPRQLARRMLDIEEDPSLQWAIADRARTEAYEFFSLTRFTQQHRQAYQSFAAGNPIDLPETAPGAGQRFHGRV